MSVFGSAALDQILQPKDFCQALHKALIASPNNQNGLKFLMRMFRHASYLTVYVADPLAGLIIGVFVGLTHKRCAMIIALTCMVPQLSFRFVFRSN